MLTTSLGQCKIIHFSNTNPIVGQLIVSPADIVSSVLIGGTAH